MTIPLQAYNLNRAVMPAFAGLLANKQESLRFLKGEAPQDSMQHLKMFEELWTEALSNDSV